jgi:heme/copper-type cytochrome/quinol oxidase subunit 2
MLRKFVKPGAAALLAVLAAPAHAAWSGLNMPTGVTTLSGEIYELHMLIFLICVIIGIVVFGWMIVSLVRFRKSQGAVPDTRLVHSTRAEILWTIIPVFILVAMAVPATRTLIDIEDGRGSGSTSTWMTVSAISRRCRVTAMPRDSRIRAWIPSRYPTTCFPWTTRWSCRWAGRCACC